MTSSTRRRSSRHGHLPFAARLRLLADLLADDLTDASRLALGVATTGDDIELHAMALTADDPVTELATITAPEAWQAFGVATGGTARLTTEPDRPHAPVRVVVLVDRHGQVVSAMTGHRPLLGPTHSTTPEPTLDLTGPGPNPTDPTHLDQGRIPDACRRVLGLPTAPPPLPPTDLLVLQWLDALTAAGLARPGFVTWAEAAALLPDPTGASWTEFRRQTTRGAPVIEDIDPSLASWMDDGMFAREALGHFPPASLMLSLLAETLPPATLARALTTLDALTTRDGATRARS